MKERRRYQRTTLRKPVLASVANTPVFILDVSNGGLRVAHQSQLPPPGAVIHVEMPGDSGRIRLNCAIVHTAIQHATSAAQSLWNSGLQIVSGDAVSHEHLETLTGSQRA